MDKEKGECKWTDKNKGDGCNMCRPAPLAHLSEIGIKLIS